MATDTETAWPYDADRDDPLTELRIPVTCFKPGWMYLVSFDRESLERPLDIDAGHNTLTLRRYGEGDWAYRRWTREFGPLFVPQAPPLRERYPDEAPIGPLTLGQVLDQINTIVDHLYQPWVEWKATHPDVFGEES